MVTRRRRDSLVLLLVWAAGSVDAVGFFGLNHVFTANMTGNTVLLGLSLGQGRQRGSEVLYILIAFSARAMGIQSAAVSRQNLPGVATTYFTETITS
jgi:uncharacterized membrane protein YoaK (UPF0700 family)